MQLIKSASENVIYGRREVKTDAGEERTKRLAPAMIECIEEILDGSLYHKADNDLLRDTIGAFNDVFETHRIYVESPGVNVNDTSHQYILWFTIANQRAANRVGPDTSTLPIFDLYEHMRPLSHVLVPRHSVRVQPRPDRKAGYAVSVAVNSALMLGGIEMNDPNIGIADDVDAGVRRGKKRRRLD